MSEHKVEDYIDAEGQHRWRVIAIGTPGSAVEDNIVADSGQGYNNKDEMLTSFFGMFFGDYDDSFLALYNEWDPDSNRIEVPGRIVTRPQEHVAGAPPWGDSDPAL